MPLKRKVPLKRHKPLNRVVSTGTNASNTGINKRSPIKKVSEHYDLRLKIYYLIRPLFIAYYPTCRAGLPGCTHITTEIHHKTGRGIWVAVVKFLLPVCRNCHDIIGSNTTEAVAKRLSESRVKNHAKSLQIHDTGTIKFLIGIRHLLKMKLNK